MEQEEIQKVEPVVINIFPITKGKRVLLYLADMFICLILSFILYNVCAFPIYYYASDYSSVREEADNSNAEMNRILKDYNLLYFKDYNTEYADMNAGLSYSFELFVKDYVSNIPNKEHDVFKNYYFDVLNDKDRYYESFSLFNNDKYFNIDNNSESITLKDDYVTLFQSVLSSLDGLSDDGKTEYDAMFDKFYLTFYSRVINDIGKHDLIKGALSFNALKAIVTDANKKYDTMILVSTYVSFALAFVVCYLLVPLTNEHRKTIGMLMMRIQKINIDTMKTLEYKHVVLSNIYALFTNLLLVFLVPVLTMSVEYIFHLSLSLWLSFTSLLIVSVSLIVVVAKESNQALSDCITHTAYITNDSLDEIYRARGYYI